MLLSLLLCELKMIIFILSITRKSSLVTLSMFTMCQISGSRNIILFSQILYGLVLILALFYKWANWGLGNLINLSKILQQYSGRGRVWTKALPVHYSSVLSTHPERTIHVTPHTQSQLSTSGNDYLALFWDISILWFSKIMTRDIKEKGIYLHF